jgi:two-component system CheB/CheR fusion protein
LSDVEPDIAGLRRQLGEAELRAQHVRTELQHRVRNVLAMISAVARRTAEVTGGVEEYARHLDGRIGAIIRAQSTALRDPLGTVDLHQLIAEELLAHAAVEGEQLRISGPSVALAGRAVGAMWLAIHELAVNSVKFGALSTREGQISVSWRLVRNGRPSLRLRWTERHNLPIPGERRSGFGTEVVERMLAYELGGTGALAFTPNGMECRITLPISGDVRVETP